MGRVLGIDYGEKRIGLSICDPERTLAVAKGLIDNGGFDDFVGVLKRIITESEIELLVFGLPLHLSGEESDSSRKVREAADYVSVKTGLPVDFQDERMTTKISAQPLLLEKKKHREKKGARDQGAAVLILQTYLDRKRNS